MNKIANSNQADRFLKVASHHLRAMLVGFVLFLVGGLYAIWGFQQIDPEKAPSLEDAFDRPIARLAQVSAPSRERLRALEASTELEEKLIEELDQSIDTVIRLFVFILRFSIANLILVMGLILITFGLTSRQFVGIVHKMQGSSSPRSSVVNRPRYDPSG